MIHMNKGDQPCEKTSDMPDKPPCDCGNPEASWHGDPYGRRKYCCDKCLARKLNVTPRTNERTLLAGDIAPEQTVVHASFAGQLEREVAGLKWELLNYRNKLNAAQAEINQLKQKYAGRVNDDQKYLVEPLCSAETQVDELRAELAKKDSLIETILKERDAAIDKLDVQWQEERIKRTKLEAELKNTQADLAGIMKILPDDAKSSDAPDLINHFKAQMSAHARQSNHFQSLYESQHDEPKEARAEIENLKWQKAKAEAALELNDRTLELGNEARAEIERKDKLIEQMREALQRTMILLDAVPSYAQDYAKDEKLKQIGKMVNTDGLYALVRDALAAERGG